MIHFTVWRTNSGNRISLSRITRHPRKAVSRQYGAQDCWVVSVALSYCLPYKPEGHWFFTDLSSASVLCRAAAQSLTSGVGRGIYRFGLLKSCYYLAIDRIISRCLILVNSSLLVKCAL